MKFDSVGEGKQSCLGDVYMLKDFPYGSCTASPALCSLDVSHQASIHLPLEI